MVYTLYWSENSGAFAPQAALEEAGADYRLRVVDLGAGEHRRAEFLAVNPRAQVPVLCLDDGTVVTETAAILIHLADCHPDTGLLPPAADPRRAIAYRWLVFITLNIYDMGCRISEPEYYSHEKSAHPGIRSKARADLDAAWGMVAGAAGEGPFLLGDDFSACDLFLLMVSQWHPRPDELFARLPVMQRLCGAVRARPAVERIWSQNFPC